MSQSTSPDRRPPRPPAPELTRSYTASGYLQAEYPLLELLQLSAGLRFDHSNVYGNVLVPRAGLVLNWRELTAKLLYGEAFRAARPWDYTAGVGNRELRPERMRSAELGVGYLWRRILRLEATVYLNRLYNVLVRQAVPPDQFRWVNAGRVDTLGSEAGAELTLGPIHPFVNYTYTRSRDEQGLQIPEIAEHGANAGVRYRVTPRIHANVWGELLGARRNPKVIAATASEWIEPAFVLNGSVSFLDFQGFDFQVIAHNVLDAAYYHTSNLEPDRYRQPQRTVLLKAAYRF